MDKSRQQFEEWRSKNKSSTINLFDVWQASRESLEIELPRKHDVDDEYDYFAMGYNLALNKIHDLLVVKGVKVK